MPRFSASKSLISVVIFMLGLVAEASPKRDFRGAWIQTVSQCDFPSKTDEQNRQSLRRLLDNLNDAGINVVIFQVRPAADAFYPSSIEPWSRFLTGSRTAKAPGWDPLQFMIDECHQRGMELHAWLNPYRITTVADEKLPADHFTRKNPERYVTFNRRLYFNPALEENRRHIVNVVSDIVSRYDVDGIHFDDYFYPYPNGKEQFADDKHYKASANGLSLGDWRRGNVDRLIEDVHNAIVAIKPWVRFGISPFGIWRNKSSDADGSETSGLQNYDDLFADVPAWAARGWIDYQIPQLYWELDHRRASYRTLCRWWAAHGNGRHIYIGQDVKKTADASELDAKLDLVAEAGDEAIQGNCWWYAANLATLAPSLKEKAYSLPALVPEYLWLQAEPAEKPHGLAVKSGRLTWASSDHARKWVVYRFESEAGIDIENSEAIVGVTYSPSLSIDKKGCYVVTALDFANGESAPSKPITVNKL